MSFGCDYRPSYHPEREVGVSSSGAVAGARKKKYGDGREVPDDPNIISCFPGTRKRISRRVSIEQLREEAARRAQ